MSEPYNQCDFSNEAGLKGDRGSDDGDDEMCALGSILSWDGDEDELDSEHTVEIQQGREGERSDPGPLAQLRTATSSETSSAAVDNNLCCESLPLRNEIAASVVGAGQSRMPSQYQGVAAGNADFLRIGGTAGQGAFGFFGIHPTNGTPFQMQQAMYASNDGNFGGGDNGDSTEINQQRMQFASANDEQKESSLHQLQNAQGPAGIVSNPCISSFNSYLGSGSVNARAGSLNMRAIGGMPSSTSAEGNVEGGPTIVTANATSQQQPQQHQLDLQTNMSNVNALMQPPSGLLPNQVEMWKLFLMQQKYQQHLHSQQQERGRMTQESINNLTSVDSPNLCAQAEPTGTNRNLADSVGLVFNGPQYLMPQQINQQKQQLGCLGMESQFPTKRSAGGSLTGSSTTGNGNSSPNASTTNKERLSLGSGDVIQLKTESPIKNSLSERERNGLGTETIESGKLRRDVPMHELRNVADDPSNGIGNIDQNVGKRIAASCSNTAFSIFATKGSMVGEDSDHGRNCKSGTDGSASLAEQARLACAAAVCARNGGQNGQKELHQQAGVLPALLPKPDKKSKESPSIRTVGNKRSAKAMRKSVSSGSNVVSHDEMSAGSVGVDALKSMRSSTGCSPSAVKVSHNSVKNVQGKKSVSSKRGASNARKRSTKAGLALPATVSDGVGTTEATDTELSCWSDATMTDVETSCFTQRSATRSTAADQCDASGLSEEEKTRINRDRNREHARNTRLRKKVYLEKLKVTVDELCGERDSLVNERANHANKMLEQHKLRVEVLMGFFALRMRGERLRGMWTNICEESVACTLPITPYRSFPSNEVQAAQCQRTVQGIDAIIADTASLQVLLDSLIDYSIVYAGGNKYKSARVLQDDVLTDISGHCQRVGADLAQHDMVASPHFGSHDDAIKSFFPRVNYQYSVVTEDAVSSGNQLMARWSLRTLNAVPLGAHAEITKQGMLFAKFSSANKVVGLEFMFDVMAFMLQLKHASGGAAMTASPAASFSSFKIVPNTVQTAQRLYEQPMVLTIAEHPYTIVQVNRLWELMTGYGAEEVVGKNDCQILQGQDDSLETRAALRELMVEVRFKRAATGVLVNATKSGHKFRHVFQVFPLSTDGKITHYIGLTVFHQEMVTSSSIDGSLSHCQPSIHGRVNHASSLQKGARMNLSGTKRLSWDIGDVL